MRADPDRQQQVVADRQPGVSKNEQLLRNLSRASISSWRHREPAAGSERSGGRVAAGSRRHWNVWVTGRGLGVREEDKEEGEIVWVVVVVVVEACDLEYSL